MIIQQPLWLPGVVTGLAKQRQEARKRRNPSLSFFLKRKNGFRKDKELDEWIDRRRVWATVTVDGLGTAPQMLLTFRDAVSGRLTEPSSTRRQGSQDWLSVSPCAIVIYGFFAEVCEGDPIAEAKRTAYALEPFLCSHERSLMNDYRWLFLICLLIPKRSL